MLVNTRDALDRGWSIFSPFCFWFRAGTGLPKTESYQDAKNNSAIGVLLSAKVAHAPGGRLCQIILEVRARTVDERGNERYLSWLLR